MTSTLDDGCCYTLKANSPISNSIGMYYFEVEILNSSQDLYILYLILKDCCWISMQRL